MRAVVASAAFDALDLNGDGTLVAQVFFFFFFGGGGGGDVFLFACGFPYTVSNSLLFCFWVCLMKQATQKKGALISRDKG